MSAGAGLPIDGGPRKRWLYLRSAYVYLQDCNGKCGNCGKPHADHHHPAMTTCKTFRGWQEANGCEACRNTLADRIDETRPAQ